MTIQAQVMRHVLEWAFPHLRARMMSREAWGIMREAGRLPTPFEPELFGDLRRLAVSAPDWCGHAPADVSRRP